MTNAKALGMVLVAVLTYIWAALTDGGVDRQEWIVATYTLVGAVGVYIVPNLSVGVGRYAKGIVAVLTAGLAVLQVVVVGGLTQAELIEVVLAGLAAIGLTVGVRNPGYVFATKSGLVSRSEL